MMKRQILGILFFVLLFSIGAVSVFSANDISSDSIIRSSTVINSLINHSVIDSSYVSNSTMLYTNTLNATLGNITCRFADIQNDVLLDGLCDYGSYTYSGPFNISLIYEKVNPTSVGIVNFSKSPVKPGDTVKIYFTKDINLNVNYSIDFSGTVIKGNMSDDGNNGDSVAGDGIYTATFTVPSVSSGNYIATVDFSDVYGNSLQNLAYLTVDSQAPTFTSVFPNNVKINTTVINVQVNTSESSSCRFGVYSGSNIPFSNLPYVMSGTLYHNFLFDSPQGNVSLLVKCSDPAGNIGSTYLNFSVDYTSPLLQFVSPASGKIVYGDFIAGLNYFDANPLYETNLYIDGLKQSLPQYNTTLILRFENSVLDSSVYQHSVSGSVGYTTGVFGNAAVFSGSQCLTVPNDARFASSSAVAFWIKTSSASGTIAQYGDSSNGYSISLSSGAISVNIENSGASYSLLSSAIDDGVWHNVVVSFGATSRLYVDNKLVDSVSGTYSASSSGLSIGCSGTSYFTGDLDSFAIFPTSLYFPYATQQDFPMLYYIVNSSNFDDGQHTLFFSAQDSFGNNGVSFTRSFYSNNHVENLVLLNFGSGAHLKNNQNLEYIVPADTKKLTLSTNCGSIPATTTNWDNVLWVINTVTQTGCWLNAIAYDNDGNVLDSLNVTNIEIDNTPPQLSFSLLNPTNGRFTLKINGSSDISYSDLYVNCSSQDFIMRTFYRTVNLDLSNFYGLCDFTVEAYDEVGNLNSTTKQFFIDSKPPVLKLNYSGAELKNNQILNGTVMFNIQSSDDSYPLSYEFCIDSQCSSSGTTISLNTSQYMQSWHELYVCANDSVDNFGCSPKYLTYFDNLIGKHQLYIFDFVNGSYVYGVNRYDIHLPYGTYNLKIYLDGAKIFDGYNTTYFFNSSKFVDGSHTLLLEAYDNLGNLLGEISYTINVNNVVLSAPTLSLKDRYDKDGIIQLNWTSSMPSSSLKYYEIFRAEDNGTFVYLDKTVNPYYSDFLNEGKFSYYVVPVNLAGKLGDASNRVYTEVRKEPVSGNFVMSKINVKAGDVVTFEYYAYDSRNLTVNVDIPSFTTVNLPLINHTSDGYLYSANYTVPYYTGTLPVVLNVSDFFGFDTLDDYYLSVDSQVPSAQLYLRSLGATGFENFNKSVTAVPLIYYSVNTPASSCLVKEAVLSEEFSNVTMKRNGITYSGDFYGYPYSNDYMFEGNFTKSISMSSGLIYARLYLKEGMNLSFGSEDLSYSSGELHLGDITASLAQGWYELLIEFNSTKKTLYINGISWTGSGFSLTNLDGHNMEIDTLILSPADNFGFKYASCSGSLYLSLADGMKTVFALVKDNVGNVNVTTATIFLNKTGAQLDVTPPIMYSVYSKRRFMNDGNFSFYWKPAYDYEQSLINVPLSYKYQLYKYPATLTSCAGTTTSTSVKCYLSVQNNETYYMNVTAVNSAGLASNTSRSNNVTIDMFPPTVPEISSSTYPQQCPVWYSAKDFNVSWNATDNISGVKDFYYNLYYYNLTAMGLTPLQQFSNTTNMSYPLSHDGVLYFYVGARDNTGNVGNFAEYKICSDLTPPTIPKLVSFYQIVNTTDLYVSWLASSDVGGSGIAYYNISLFNTNNVVVDSKTILYTAGFNEYNTTFSGYLDASKYYAKVRAVDNVGNPSEWSDEFASSYDRTPPVFIYTTPSGNTTGNNVKLTVKTDEIAVCSYNSTMNPNLQKFLFTNSTYHETQVYVPDSQIGNTIYFDIYCVNQVGLVNSTRVSFSFVGDTVSLGGISLTNVPSRVVSGTLMTVSAHVTGSSGQGIANIPRSWFDISYHSSVNWTNVTDFALSDFGGGNYNITFVSPYYDRYSISNDDPNFNLSVRVSSPTTSVSVNANFTASELQGVMALNEPSPDPSMKYIVSNVSGLQMGIATDDNSLYAVPSGKSNIIEGNLNTGAFYLFVAPKSADVASVQPLLYGEKFIQSPGQSFSRISASSNNQIDVIVPFSNESVTNSFSMPSGDYKVQIVHVGYDSNGNPIYQFNIIN